MNAHSYSIVGYIVAGEWALSIAFANIPAKQLWSVHWDTADLAKREAWALHRGLISSNTNTAQKKK